MRAMFLLYFFLVMPFSLLAMFIGNPADPSLYTQGIRTEPSWWSFRFGYLDDWVYKQSFHDEFKLDNEPHTQTLMKLSTYASYLSLNIFNRWDLYGIVGSSRMQLDHEIFTKRALGWGAGTKVIFCNIGDLVFSFDCKYFQTEQKPRYFVVNHLPFNVVSKFNLIYHSWQAAIGACYKIHNWLPYANLTYFFSKIEPFPHVLLVRLPDTDEAVDVISKAVIATKRWGMALGLSLLDEEKATLALEWRAWNENGVNVNGEIRF